MQTFEPWDVVKVPFPYTDRPVRERRPALVAASGSLQEERGLLWVLMITSATGRASEGNVPVSDPAHAGLPVPSIVRAAKIATIDAKQAVRIGTLPAGDRRAVIARLEVAPAGLRTSAR